MLSLPALPSLMWLPSLVASIVPSFAMVVWAVCICALTALVWRGMFVLGHDELLRLKACGGEKVRKGPGLVFVNPLSFRSAKVEKAMTLSFMDYALVSNVATGLERIECGPCLLFLGPCERAASPGKAISICEGEYVLIEDKRTGDRSVEKGPCMWFPKGPQQTAKKAEAVSMSATEYIEVMDRLTGDRRIVKGPLTWIPGPYENASAVRKAIPLQEDEYVLLRDVSTGRRWIQTGQALVFLEPMWRVEGTSTKETGVKRAWVLKSNEYLRLLDVATGKVTVHRGEAKVFPGPNDKLMDDGIRQAVAIDSEHAVLVRDDATGQLRLVTDVQAFVPGPNETIEEVRELIKLAEHEAMIIKDQNAVFSYHYGSEAKRAPGQPRSFFLPPYCEIQKIWWSRGPRRDRKDDFFDRFDLRPHFMKFEFNCRTADNVELVLEGVFFWEIEDVPKMFLKTGDTSGDIVYHMRSQFIQAVAGVGLKEFMERLHIIANKILADDTEFYETRGIKVHSLEVTRYECADKSTSAILSQIIQETTSRMNRLSQAESESEVNIFRTQSQVEEARLQSGLLAIQHEQAEAEAKVAGTSEADKVKAFLSGLEAEVPDLEDRIKVWEVLRKREALATVAGGAANLYFTPSDVDLSIETRTGPPLSAPQNAAKRS